MASKGPAQARPFYQLGRDGPGQIMLSTNCMDLNTLHYKHSLVGLGQDELFSLNPSPAELLNGPHYTPKPDQIGLGWFELGLGQTMSTPMALPSLDHLKDHQFWIRTSVAPSLD